MFGSTAWTSPSRLLFLFLSDFLLSCLFMAQTHFPIFPQLKTLISFNMSEMLSAPNREVLLLKLLKVSFPFPILGHFILFDSSGAARQ